MHETLDMLLRRLKKPGKTVRSCASFQLVCTVSHQQFKIVLLVYPCFLMVFCTFI